MEQRTRPRAAVVAGEMAVDAAVASTLALAAMFICGYRFGVDDQAQYLVQLIALEHPGIFGDDPYTSVFGSLWSVFWIIIASLTDEPRALSLLLIHLVITVVNALLLARVLRAMLPTSLAPWARMVGSFVAPALLVVPKELNWFGLVSLSDRELTATFGTVPFLLLSILLWTRGARWWCALPALLAVPVHAQTGAYLLAAWGCSLAMLSLREPALRRLAAVVLVVGIGACVALVIRWGIPTASHAEYVAVGMGLYPELIDPLNASVMSWGVTGIVMLMGLIGAIRLRAHSETNDGVWRLSVWAAGTLVLPVVGLIAHASGVDEPFLLKLMVGRSLMLTQIAALLFVAAWCLRAACARSVVAWVGATAVVLLVCAWPLEGIGPVLAVLMPFSAIGVMLLVRWDHAPIDAGASGRVMLTTVTGWVLVGTLGVHAARTRPSAWLDTAEEPAWRDVQRCAREQTPPASMFVTPPYLSGWRVGSHRPTFAEVKDGCLLFYAGEPVLAWRDRVRLLGMQSPFVFIEIDRLAGAGAPTSNDGTIERLRSAYRDALRRNLAEIRAAAAPSYVVLERSHDIESLGASICGNDRFVIRRVDR